MSPQEQRVAIAEACGLEIISPSHPEYNQYNLQHRKDGWACRTESSVFKWTTQAVDRETAERWKAESENIPGRVESIVPKERIESVPHYLEDLNAMHEAEKLIVELCKSPEYGDELRRLCKEATWFATAAQRAEAFLRTIGRWA